MTAAGASSWMQMILYCYMFIPCRYYIESLGYGNEGKDDVGEALTVQLGTDPVTAVRL